jgi:uncharacterized protein YxjI
MNYPLKLSFKIFALAPQIRVADNAGNLIFYVKQKLFKLKEAVTVFADEAQTKELFKINADRILDFSASYQITTIQGEKLGSVRRAGMKSIWKAHYTIFDKFDKQIMNIREENPWVKVADALLGEVPFLGLFMGYFFHPSYLVTLVDGTPVFRLKKQPAFLEKAFSIENLQASESSQDTVTLLSLLMLTLLERGRG